MGTTHSAPKKQKKMAERIKVIKASNRRRLRRQKPGDQEMRA